MKERGLNDVKLPDQDMGVVLYNGKMTGLDNLVRSEMLFWRLKPTIFCFLLLSKPITSKPLIGGKSKDLGKNFTRIQQTESKVSWGKRKVGDKNHSGSCWLCHSLRKKEQYKISSSWRSRTQLESQSESREKSGFLLSSFLD